MGDTMLDTERDWCAVHKSAEFANGQCAVAALAPIPISLPCDFTGTVHVAPLEGTKGFTEEDKPPAEYHLRAAHDEINRLSEENERLQRRCEIYASCVTAVAYPISGTTMAGVMRIAQNTLDRLRRLEIS